jgi:fermentation-respiration switch protein FrsA (DUF1100 family)
MLVKILVIIIAVIFMLVAITKRFVYFHPSQEEVPLTEKYTDVYEGNLHGWYKKGSSGVLILFCHGNAGNITYRQNKIRALNSLGHSVLIFDYSGFGRSKGVPSEEMCFANSDIFYRYAKHHLHYKTIIPYGESLGGAVAMYIARKYATPAVILESGITSITDTAISISKALGIFAPLFPEFNTVEYLTGYKGKVLALHCTNDEVIPFYLVEEKIKPHCTEFVVMEGSHNYPNIPWEKIGNFLSLNK